MRRSYRWVTLSILGLLLVFGSVPDSVAADEKGQGPPTPVQNWQVSLTPSYTSGNFGGSTTTNFVYVPLTIRRLFKDGDISLVLPYVYSKTDGRVTLVGGNPLRVQDDKGGGSGSGGSGGSTDDCPGQRQNRGKSCLSGLVSGQTAVNSGMGDIILKGRYYLVDEKEWLPLIAVTGRIKVPTADETKGLGTGKFDEGAGLEVSKFLSDKWITFLDGGYTIIGKPDGLNLRNQWWYDVGAGYYVTRDLLASVYFEQYRSLVSGQQNARDLLFAVNYTATSAWRFNASAQIGLSNGAPDYGVTAGAGFRF